MMSQVVAIQGVGFVNKGAELMLRAIMQNLEDREVVLATGLRCGSFNQRSELGLYHLPWLFIARLPVSASVMLQRVASSLLYAIPRRVRHSTHVLCDADVSAVLDASGFCYSDQQGIVGAKITRMTARNVRKWKKEGKKIVFLPQAFGPFRDQQMKHYASQIVENSDLIFARDTTSLEFLLDLPVDSQNIKVAPDFTCLVRGVCPDYFNPNVKRPCIIPNYRMVDRTSPDVGENYPSFLTKCIIYLIKQDLDPFILVHEELDIAFATDIQRKLPKSVEIIREPNPVYIKGILGNCSFVISSRYHGLINALSQGVPGLATSWSHKYQMLLEDYDCPECLLSVSASEDEIRGKIDMVSTGRARADLFTRLEDAGLKQRGLVLDMWKEVYKVLSI
jgi:polysaccharide pyruvyl transferase WcaK-like protein